MIFKNFISHIWDDIIRYVCKVKDTCPIEFSTAVIILRGIV